MQSLGHATQGFFFAMASLPHKWEPPLGAGSLLLSLGLHLVLVSFVLVAGWQKIPPTSPVLEVSLVGPPPGDHASEPGKTRNIGPAEDLKTNAPQTSPESRMALKTILPKLASALVKKRRNPTEPSPTRAVKDKAKPSQGPLTLAPAAPSPMPSPVDFGLNRDTGGLPSSGTVADATGATGLRAGKGSGRGTEGRGPGTGGGGSGALAAAQTQYLSLIRMRILAYRQYPPLAKARHMEGEVRLRFVLNHNGALNRGVQIVKPSGFSVLDEQASRCVLAAAPFPPFPPELRQESLTIEVPIVYRLKDFSG